MPWFGSKFETPRVQLPPRQSRSRRRGRPTKGVRRSSHQRHASATEAGCGTLITAEGVRTSRWWPLLPRGHRRRTRAATSPGSRRGYGSTGPHGAPTPPLRGARDRSCRIGPQTRRPCCVRAQHQPVRRRAPRYESTSSCSRRPRHREPLCRRTPTPMSGGPAERCRRGCGDAGGRQRWPTLRRAPRLTVARLIGALPVSVAAGQVATGTASRAFRAPRRETYGGGVPGPSRKSSARCPAPSMAEVYLPPVRSSRRSSALSTPCLTWSWCSAPSTSACSASFLTSSNPPVAVCCHWSV